MAWHVVVGIETYGTADLAEEVHEFDTVMTPENVRVGVATAALASSDNPGRIASLVVHPGEAPEPPAEEQAELN